MKKLICSAVCCFLPTFALADSFIAKETRDATFSIVRSTVTYPFTITPESNLTGGYGMASRTVAKATLGTQANMTAGMKLGVRWDTSQGTNITVGTDMKKATIGMNGDSTKTINLEFSATQAVVRTVGQEQYLVDNRMAPITPYEVMLNTASDTSYINPGTYELRVQSAVYNP